MARGGGGGFGAEPAGRREGGSEGSGRREEGVRSPDAASPFQPLPLILTFFFHLVTQRPSCHPWWSSHPI